MWCLKSGMLSFFYMYGLVFIEMGGIKKGHEKALMGRSGAPLRNLSSHRGIQFCLLVIVEARKSLDVHFLLIFSDTPSFNRQPTLPRHITR